MLYRGTVTSNHDAYQSFQVFVKVDGIHLSNNEAIQAEVIGSTEFGLNDGIGLSSVLRVGTRVWVMFEDEDSGNFGKPVVIGVIHEVNDRHPTLQSEYDKAQVIKTQSGHTITISDFGGNERIDIYHKSGTDVLIDNQGNIIIHGVKDFNSKIDGNYNLSVSGDITINSNGAINSTSSSDTVIKGSNIRLN